MLCPHPKKLANRNQQSSFFLDFKSPMQITGTNTSFNGYCHAKPPGLSILLPFKSSIFFFVEINEYYSLREIWTVFITFYYSEMNFFVFSIPLPFQVQNSDKCVLFSLNLECFPWARIYFNPPCLSLPLLLISFFGAFCRTVSLLQCVSLRSFIGGEEFCL